MGARLSFPKRKTRPEGTFRGGAESYGGNTKDKEGMMDKYREMQKAFGGARKPRLRYPLEHWIEQLLRQYPEELASIRPERWQGGARMRPGDTRRRREHQGLRASIGR